jgi:hypothetical protein
MFFRQFEDQLLSNLHFYINILMKQHHIFTENWVERRFFEESNKMTSGKYETYVPNIGPYVLC